MYSAKKQQGRKLYELARRGEAVERMPVRVMIREFTIQDPQSAPPTMNENGTFDLEVRVVCSAGTYVRTLAEDLGKQLGVGAHLVALRRTRAGDFQIAHAVTLEELERAVEGNELGGALLSMDTALSQFPFVHLSEADANWTRNGRSIGIGIATGTTWVDGEKVRMRGQNGSLIAVGSFDAASRTLQPRIVMTTE